MTRPSRPGPDGPPEKERAFELLFREKTFSLIWRWLARLGIPLRDRGDLAQDILFSAYQSFENYNPAISRPERWLNRITVHTAAHYRERAQHRYEELVMDEELPPLVDQSQPPDQLIMVEQERLMVLELLQQLDLDAYSILAAHDLDGIPMAEIAQQRGVPLSTAYKWRARALSLFHDIVVKRRREDRKKEGSLCVLPLDVAALFAAARIAPRVPEDVRLAVVRGVQESVRAFEAASATTATAGAGKAVGDAVTWLKAIWRRLAPLRSTVGATPAVITTAAATVVAGTAWLGSPDPPPPPLVMPVRSIVMAVTPPEPPPPPAAPEPPPPAAPAPVVRPPQVRATGGRRARVPAPSPPAPSPPAPSNDAISPGNSLDVSLFKLCSDAVSRRDPVQAIQELERYDREVPASAFASERSVLWIRALWMARRYSEARARLVRARLDPTIDPKLLEGLDREDAPTR
jgi:RNA polymerase sigma factor (sigma-70 family)